MISFLLKKKIELAHVYPEVRIIPNLPDASVTILPDYSPTDFIINAFQDVPRNPGYARWQNDDKTPLRAILKMGFAFCIKRYTFEQWTDPGNCTGRTPTAWNLWGSNDKETWDLLDARTGQFGQSTANGYTLEYQTPRNKKFYAYLKIEFTANKGDPYWSIGQMRFYGGKRK